MPTTFQSSTSSNPSATLRPFTDATPSVDALCAPASVQADCATRRAVDVCVASTLLVLALPALAALCAAVCATSPGAPFFLQERVGRGGRRFRICKFRTMHAGTDALGPAVTAVDDTRITPLGRWLRDNKLDELPQLFNVLRGDMSLVGPRPQVPRFVERFDPQKRDVVLSVRPGITGPTTLFFRHEERMLEGQADREAYYIQSILPVKLNMDAEYVCGRTLSGDLGVLTQTLRLFSGALASRLLRRAR